MISIQYVFMLRCTVPLRFYATPKAARRAHQGGKTKRQPGKASQRPSLRLGFVADSVGRRATFRVTSRGDRSLCNLQSSYLSSPCIAAKWKSGCVEKDTKPHHIEIRAYRISPTKKSDDHHKSSGTWLRRQTRQFSSEAFRAKQQQ